MNLGTPVTELRSVGPKRARALGQLGIKTIDDLIHYYPSRVEFPPGPALLRGQDRGSTATVTGTVLESERDWFSGTFGCTVLSTLSERVHIRWYNSRYLHRYIQRGTKLVACGPIDDLSMCNPQFKILPTCGDLVAHARTVMPHLRKIVYPVVAGITSKDISGLIKQVGRFISSTLQQIHDPSDQDAYDKAIAQEKYDELFYMQLALAMRKQTRDQTAANVRCISVNMDLARYFPFTFTEDQRGAISDITQDMGGNSSMNRLLQGDVGCVDADTEFLSPSGWIPISKWGGEEVLQYNPATRGASFVIPLRYIREPCSEFICIRTKYGVSQMLSPEHRCLVYKYSKVTKQYDRAVVLPAEQMEQEHNDSKLGFRGRFETSFTLEGRSRVPLTSSELRVMVAVCADGHIASKSTVVLSFKRPYKIDRAKWLLDAAGIHYGVTTSSGYTRIRFRPPVLRKGLEQYWCASPGQLHIISDEVVHWDGDQHSKFYTCKKAEADFIQYAFSACGYRARLMTQLRNGGKFDYVVGRYEKTKTGIMSNPKGAITREPSRDGFKYCFTVPDSFLVLRRNGCVFITGNCGKTAVAASAAMLMACNGGQTAILCPTEVLAKQHYAVVREWFGVAGLNCELVTGSAPTYKGILLAPYRPRLDHTDVVIGTTAILGNIQWDNLGLVVVDEQHKFGVEQRAALQKRGNPHVLLMSATPIPRTIAMTAFGDLDVSTIKTMPPGRRPVETYWRTSLYSVARDALSHSASAVVREELAKGNQVYVVCPRIEALDDEMRAVEEVVFEYREQFSSVAGISQLHGSMTPDQKHRTCEWWSTPDVRGKILVATTVVEVGIDNPNATVMVIEGAERFGLAQLHQLRGRVGRSDKQSYCFLLSDTESSTGRSRLKIMEQTNDGFKIAEHDLKMRGPGDILSTRQHGMPDLKLADLVEDFGLMLTAQQAARDLVSWDPVLAKDPCMRDELQRRFPEYLTLGGVG
ncbi:MAG: DEAD/DEAH box helicase [Candidatus Aegiribacteria sp.]|nr:DEAD/DEAH box helicase [Candidatus Aegiribacteria sp.]